MRTRISFLLLSALVCFSCSKPSSDTKPNTDSLAVSAESPADAAGADVPTDGNRVHVTAETQMLDEPSVGKPIAAVKAGGNLALIGRGPFEVLQGTPDYWIQVEANGKKGWVFGAFTDLRTYEPGFVIATGDQLWAEFSKQKKSDCSDGACRVEDESTTGFTISSGDESGTTRVQYRRNNMDKDLFTIVVETGKGDALFCVTTQLLIASAKQGTWNLAARPIPGQLEKQIKLDSQSEAWITRSAGDCGAFVRDLQWEGFVVTRGTPDFSPFFTIEGASYSKDSGERTDLTDGDEYTREVSVEAADGGVTVDEHRYKFLAEGEDAEAQGSPRKVSFRWDASARKMTPRN